MTTPDDIDPQEAGEKLLTTARLMARTAHQIEELSRVLFQLGAALGGDYMRGMDAPDAHLEADYEDRVSGSDAD